MRDSFKTTLAIVCFVFASCSEDRNSNESTVTPSDNIETSPAENISDSEVSSMVNDSSVTAQSEPSSDASAVQQQAAPRLNPPHGEPGHRCDMNVGDPLPDESGSTGPVTVSSPAVINTTEQSGNKSIMYEQPAGVQSGGAATAKLNPPHGEPGHRCDINVGDPLPQ